MAVDNQEKQVNNDAERLQFGWAKFRPRFLQFLNTPKWFLFFLCMYFFTQSIVVNGVYSVSITTIEKRYRYSSFLTGFLTSSYDIAALIFTPFISFLGARRKRPKWCGVGLFTMGVGILVFMLPHLIAGRYEAGAPQAQRRTSLCNSTYGADNACGTSSTSQWGYYSLFIIGMVVMGVGTTPMIALGVPYIDENVKSKVSPMYIGIFFASGVLGAGVGFILGGVFLSLYVDLGVQTPLTPKDERWVGAWWLGFAICGSLCILWSIWLFGFPIKIPGKGDKSTDEQARTYSQEGKHAVPGAGIKEIKNLPKATKDLVLNIPYISITIAGSMEMFIISGLTAFLPKVLQSQFRLPTSQVSFLYGVIAVPAALGGSLFGSYINKKLRLTLSGASKMCLIVAVLSMLSTGFLLISCDTIPIAGVNKPYVNSSSSVLTSCNMQCACSVDPYSPVCGNGVTYVSPCFAGCVKESVNGTLSGCSCLTGVEEVTRGSCPASCGVKLPLVLGAIFLLCFFLFLNETPATIVTLRCVATDKRTYGIGLQWVLFRLLGFIPGPIVMGSLIDKTCILWDERCKGEGNCLEYDNKQLAVVVFVICFVSKLIAVLGMFICWIFCRKHTEANTPDNAETNNKNSDPKPKYYCNDSFTL